MPSEITKIDMRIDQSNPPPTASIYDPRVPSQRQTTSNEHDFYNLCKGTNALLLQTLYSDEFESDDEDETSHPTMTDAFKTMDNAQDFHSIKENLKDIFTPEVISQIEEATVGQNEKPRVV